MTTRDSEILPRHNDTTPVSVVIPLYNARHTVRRAVCSVLDQTHSNLQLIVINDGSTDDSIAQLQSLNDSRLHIVEQSNAGVSAARNAGIAHAAYSLIAFLDADDLWKPDHLSAIVSLHNKYPKAQAYATAYTIQKQNASPRTVKLHNLPANSQGPLKDYFKLAIRSEPPVCSSSVAATKSALQAIGGFPLGVGQGEDLLTWARLACHVDIAYDASPSAVIHPPHTNDSSPVRTPPQNDLVGNGLTACLKNTPRHKQPSLKRYIAHWQKMRATMFIRLGDKSAARRELAKALPHAGFNPKLWAWTVLACLPQAMTDAILKKRNTNGSSDLQTQPKLAILTNLIAPYRIPIYNALAQNFNTSIILSGSEPNRTTWDNLAQKLPLANIQHTRGATITQCDKQPGPSRNLRWLHINPGYILRLFKQKPHAVLSAEMGFRTLCALAYGSIKRKPVWIWWGGTQHTERSITTTRRAFRYLITRWANHFITYGSDATLYLTDLNVPRTNILQIQNCVDDKAFANNSQHTQNKTQHPSLLCVGQHIQRKGGQQLIESVARLQRQGHAFSLTFVGDGPEEKHLRQLVKNLNLTNIHFQPPTTPDHMPAYYHAATALIFPTLEDAWGLVVNEALWSNLHVASSIYAGCTTEIVPQANHFDPLIPDQIDRVLTAAIQGNLQAHNPANLLTADQVAQRIINEINHFINPTEIKATINTANQPKTCSAAA